MNKYYLILLSVVCTPCFSQIKVYGCINEDINFTTKYYIDFDKKEITHVNSEDRNTKASYFINQKLNVIEFNEKYLSTYSIGKESNALSFIVFNFAKNTYTVSGHYLNLAKKPYSQLFRCSLENLN